MSPRFPALVHFSAEAAENAQKSTAILILGKDAINAFFLIV
jgi:hypothetical protein